MNKPSTRLLFVMLLLGLAVLAWAVPGYHVNDNASARKAVEQYGENNFQFRSVVYQAQLDKSLWRLTLSAHDYLLKKPNDPARECSFAQAYWQPQRTQEQVPEAEQKKLAALYDEAVRDTKDAAQKMPRSVDAHLTYGQYLQYYVMGMGKVPQMQAEFKKAVALTPNVGEVHARLADAYFSSGPLTHSQTMAMIAEYKKAYALDPRQTNTYFELAACYYRLQDWPTVRLYINKYLTLHPEAATRPDIVKAQQILKEKLGG